jgi:hypothetical protein
MTTPREQLANVLRQSRIDAGYDPHGALARKLNLSRPVITKAENPLTRCHPMRCWPRGPGSPGQRWTR